MTQKQKGKPAVVRVAVQIQPDQLAALDAWIAERDEPGLRRPEAIRILMQMGLTDRRKGPRVDG